MLSLAARINLYIGFGYTSLRVAEITGITLCHAVKLKQTGWIHVRTKNELWDFRNRCREMSRERSVA